ncbi:MAG: chemotaxis protein CheW [bacterium]|jgi:purine-binding chemotaxis protein CheW|nr:chemotaxis protein CheW [bacterium]
MAEQQQVCTFYLNGFFFGVDVKIVQEVNRFQSMTPVPMAPRVVSGLINLRGQIVTAIDLRRRLEMPDRDDSKAPMNVVIRDAETVHSLLVDEVGDVVSVDESTWEAPPDTLEGRMRELITGTHKLENQLLLLLDVKNLTQLDGADAKLRDLG